MGMAEDVINRRQQGGGRGGEGLVSGDEKMTKEKTEVKITVEKETAGDGSKPAVNDVTIKTQLKSI